MTVPFWFSGEYPNHPVVIGSLWHEAVRPGNGRTMMDFVIDTGADRTYLGPDARSKLMRLGVPPESFQPYPYDLVTIKGPVRVDFLRTCTLRFDRYDIGGQTDDEYVLRPPVLLVARTITVEKGPRIPNLLGRDILSKMALGYSYEPRHVFLTQRCHDYCRALAPHFYNPNARRRPGL